MICEGGRRILPEAPIWADCIMTGVAQACQSQFQKFLLWFGSVDLIGKAGGMERASRGGVLKGRCHLMIYIRCLLSGGALRKVNEIFPLLQRISWPLVLYHWMSVFSAGDHTLPP